jgi:hypothetical protein
MEPEYFRTEFLNSKSVSYAAQTIGAYTLPAGATREATGSVSGKQLNDLKKLAQALLTPSGWELIS